MEQCHSRACWPIGRAQLCDLLAPEFIAFRLVVHQDLRSNLLSGTEPEIHVGTLITELHVLTGKQGVRVRTQHLQLIST
jgi:hypothetical protein